MKIKWKNWDSLNIINFSLFLFSFVLYWRFIPYVLSIYLHLLSRFWKFIHSFVSLRAQRDNFLISTFIFSIGEHLFQFCSFTRSNTKKKVTKLTNLWKNIYTVLKDEVKGFNPEREGVFWHIYRKSYLSLHQ